MSSQPATDRIRALVVDDEELARSVVKQFARAHADLELVGECSNGVEAIAAIEEHKPNLVFLDIQMPRLNGFEMLELLEQPPLVIFVTAYDEYALKAFDVHACDYLRKPFDQERFDQALERARGRLQRSWQVSAREYAQLQDHARDPNLPLKRLAVRRGARVEVIATRDIDYLEARDDHVAIHVGDDSWLKHKTMTWFEQQLDAQAFLRVHRSYIVNLERLQTLEATTKDSHQAVLRTGTRVPVSKAGYRRLRERMG